MKKVALALGLLLALVGVAAMVLSTSADRGTGVAAAPSRPGRSPGTARTEAALPEGSRTPDGSRLEAPPGLAEPVAPAGSEPPAGPAPDPDALEGTILVRDAQGLEHAAQDGRLTLQLWGPAQGEQVEVPVRLGAWSAPRAEELTITAVELGGRTARVTSPAGRVQVPASGLVELEARWLAATLLHVRDEGGTALNDLELLRVTSWAGSESPHPAGVRGSQELERRPSSPVEIGGESTVRASWYVRSPGFAWGRIQLDEGTGGERLLVLQPGGGLEVELVDPAARKGLVLRLRTAGTHSQPYAEAPLAGRTTVVLEGVAPGRYAVAAELGEWFQTPTVVAEGEVEVLEGERARLELVVDAPAPAQLVPLAGRLIVPGEWELDSLILSVELLDGPTTGSGRRRTARLGPTGIDDAGDRVYRFEAGPVEPGRHEFELWPLHYSVVREVPPGGDEQLELRLPPPGTLELRVLDVDAGTDAGLATVMFHPARPEGVGGGGLENVTADPDSGLFRIRAPEGEVVVMLQGLEYQTVQDAARPTFFVRAGETTSGTLSVRRSCGFTLRVRAGGIDLPWDSDWRLEVEPLGGEGRLRGRGWSANEARFRLSEPGLYRFDFPTLDGFEPVPTQEVAVPAGEFVPHVIELVEVP